MRKIVSKFALAAGIVLALAFTFSCSSDDGGSSGATYWYSEYRIDDDVSLYYIESLYNQYENPSYNYVKDVQIEVKRIGTWIESNGGVSVQEIKDFLIRRDASPKEVDDWLAKLKKRGNAMGAFGSSPPYYIIYVERE